MSESFPPAIDALKGSSDAAGLVDAAVNWGKVGAIAAAQRFAIIAEFAAVWLAAAGDDTPLYWVDEEDDVIGEIGTAFGISPGWALGDLQIGAAMRERFPRLAALFLRGEVSAKVMATVVDRTILVTDPDALARIDEACVEAALMCGWSGLSYHKLKNAVDVWVDRYDPAAVRRVRSNVRNRGVQVTSVDEKSGTTAILARLTTPGAALVMGRLRQMARRVCPNDPRTLEQRMADSLDALAADANHLKCLCGSPTCAATADDGVASRFVVHIYAESGVVDVEPDPRIHGDGSNDPEPVDPDAVKVNYPTKKTAAETGPNPAAPQKTESATESEVPEAKSEPANHAEEAEQPKPAKPRQCPAPRQSSTAEGQPEFEVVDGADVPEPESGAAAKTADALTEPADTAARSVANITSESASPTTPPTPPGGPPAGIIPGFGITPAALLAALIAGGANVRPIQAPAIDPEETYRIPTALREYVQGRDLTCRFPGCDRPIDQADLDHTIAWHDGGPTHASNNKGYCRHHHLMKTFRDGWSDVQLPDGTIILTTPTGRTYATIPTSRLLFPNVNTTSAPVERNSPRPRGPDTAATMPKRRRTKAQDRAYRIAAERALNEAYLAAHHEPPPFQTGDVPIDSTPHPLDPWNRI